MITVSIFVFYHIYRVSKDITNRRSGGAKVYARELCFCEAVRK